MHEKKAIEKVSVELDIVNTGSSSMEGYSNLCDELAKYMQDVIPQLINLRFGFDVNVEHKEGIDVGGIYVNEGNIYRRMRPDANAILFLSRVDSNNDAIHLLGVDKLIKMAISHDCYSPIIMFAYQPSDSVAFDYNIPDVRWVLREPVQVLPLDAEEIDEEYLWKEQESPLLKIVNYLGKSCRKRYNNI